MGAVLKPADENPKLGKCPAYDPKNLHPMDLEDRQYDDISEGIDWDDIIATTQDDFEAGRFAFNTDDYPTEEAAMAALKCWTDAILDEVLHEAAAETPFHAAR